MLGVKVITELVSCNFHGGVMTVLAMSQPRHVTQSLVTAGDPRSSTRPMPRWRRNSRRGLCLALAACLAVGIAGCDTSSPDEQPQTPPPSVSAPQQDARGTAEEQALAAYREMWRAYAKAGLTANPDEPELSKYSSGKALVALQGALAAAKSARQVIKGELGSYPQVTEVTPIDKPVTVSVTDCLNTTKFLTYNMSGALVDDVPGGRRLTRATVTKLGPDEGWKVTGLGIQAVGTCA